MSITLNGTTGLNVPITGTIADGSLAPAKLTAGHPSWQSNGDQSVSGALTVTGLSTFSFAKMNQYSMSKVALSNGTIDPNAGNYFTDTISGVKTYTFTAPSDSTRAYDFVLVLTNGGSAAITWPASIKWPAGTAPTLTASGVDVLAFITDNGGATWRGAMIMKDSK